MPTRSYEEEFGEEAEKLRNPFAQSLQSRSLKEFLRLELPKRGLVIDPILPERGLMLVHAYRGIGKTYLALGMAAAVASGAKFLRWQAPRARRVLFVDGELPAATLRERAAMTIAGFEHAKLAPDALRIDEEGLRLPATPIDDAVLARIVDASRTPDERRGDLDAQRGANRLGVQRFADLVRGDEFHFFLALGAHACEGDRRPSVVAVESIAHDADIIRPCSRTSSSFAIEAAGRWRRGNGPGPDGVRARRATVRPMRQRFKMPN